MGPLLGLVLPLALGAAVSPTLLAVSLVTLSRRSAPLARAWALAAGSAVVLAGFSVAALLLAHGTTGSHGHSKVDAVVKLVAALVLVTLGVAALIRAPKPPRPERVGPHPRRQAVIIGAGLMLTNFSTIALFFPAMHAIAISHVALEGKVVVFLMLYAITLLPVAGPPAAVMVLGPRATAALHALNRFFAAHEKAINAGICFVFAALLTVTGLHALLA